MSTMFATLARKEQLPHALMLAKSVRRFHPNSQMAICMVETHLPAPSLQLFDEVLLVSGQGYPPEDSANSGPTKAYFIQYLLQRYLDDIVYLDPDTVLYSPLEEVVRLLPHRDIIAVPHNLEPYDRAMDQLEVDRLQQGFIHSGFLALRNTEHSKQFMKWWCDRINRTALGPAQTLGADHIWLSLGIVPFGIHILKEPGYHFAPWNWHESGRAILRQDNKGVTLTNGKPLRSFVTAGSEEMLQHPRIPLPPHIHGSIHELIQRNKLDMEQVRLEWIGKE